MRILIFLSSLLFTSLALTHPIFYKCDQNSQMSEFLAGEEVLAGLKKMQAALGGDEKKLFETLCRGKTECEKNLSQVLALTRISQESAIKERGLLLSKLQSQMKVSPSTQTPDELVNLEKSIRSTAAEIAACRQTLTGLDPDAWVIDGCVTFYYPIKNEYSYANGFKTEIGKKTEVMGCASPQELRAEIRKALLMGVDPNVYLSLSLMEEGFSGWVMMELDPIGVARTLGCSELKTNVTQESSGKLESFGNYHQIQSGVVKNHKLASKIELYLKEIEADVSKSKSYYCLDLENEASASILAKPNSKMCCLELSLRTNDLESISEVLTQQHIQDLQSKRPYGSNDPAFKLQAFNGFSKLMGGAEAVSVFRSGIDLTKNPAYGHQAMDYILNNLAANPWLVREIERQKQDLKLKENPPSILCEGKTPGQYYIDSKHYFDLHRNTPRMTSILNKPYDQMTIREKKVIMGEIYHLIKSGQYPQEIDGKSVNIVFKGTEADHKAKFKFVTSEGQQEVKESQHLKNILNEQILKNGFSYETPGITYTATPIGTFKLRPDLNNLSNTKNLSTSLQLPYELQYVTGESIKYDNEAAETCYDKNKKEISCLKFGRTEFKYTSYKMINSTGDGVSVNFSKVDLDVLHISSEMDHFEKFETVRTTQKITYNQGKSWITTKLATDSGRDLPQATKADLVRYYFKNIYASRNTIEKASRFGPWKEIGDQEIEKMAEILHGKNTRRIGSD